MGNLTEILANVYQLQEAGNKEDLMILISQNEFVWRELYAEIFGNPEEWDNLIPALPQSEEYFWWFAIENNLQADTMEKFQNHKFSVTGKHLEKNPDFDFYQEEMCHYYNWYIDNPHFDPLIFQAFFSYVEEIDNLDENVAHDFKESYMGCYINVGMFFHHYYGNSDKVENLASEIKDAIDWNIVAENFIRSGKFFCVDSVNYGKFIFRNVPEVLCV